MTPVTTLKAVPDPVPTRSGSVTEHRTRLSAPSVATGLEGVTERFLAHAGGRYLRA